METDPKRIKLDSEVELNGIHESLKNLKDFTNIEIINNNTSRKTICLKGNFSKKDGIGVVLLEKTSFVDSDVTNKKYFEEDCYLEKEFSNDIYGNYRFFPKLELNNLKATIIHPATEKHIAKYSKQNVYLIDETYEIYTTVILPYLKKEQFCLQWLYNILEGKSEADRIVFQDSDPEIGFILLPDIKWDGNKETLYLLAIVRKHGIKSIRDLNQDSLPLLKNILEKSCDIIKKKYDIDSSQLRIFFHYQPSFYHLHIHFTYLRHDPPGIFTEKSHMLSNVISNLELFPDYYQKVTIPFVVKESEKLFNVLQEKNLIKKIEN